MGKAYDKAEQAYVKSSDSYLEANSYPCAKPMHVCAYVCMHVRMDVRVVEFLLKDTLNKGHNTFYLSIKDKFCGPYRTMAIQFYLLIRITSL